MCSASSAPGSAKIDQRLVPELQRSKRLKFTDLNNLRYLLEVADSGSFSAAARLFGVAPSLVSRKIARLEEEVGARLFQRTTRSLTLTDAGQAFLSHARVGMQSLALAHELVGDQDGVLSGRVRLSAPVGIADALWATLSRFLVRHSGVRIELELADRYVDLVEERFDLAIRSGPERRADRLIGRRLLDAPRCLFASPDYLKLHGAPRTLSELKDHACVILGSRADRVTWQIYVGKRIQNVIVQGRVAVNEARLAAECAADGFGIAFLPLAVCAKHLAAGRLKRVLPRASAGEIGLWLVYPDRHLPAVSRALAEFLVKELPASVVVRTGRSAVSTAE
jgi:DNA-binding transcriptional LysR family regulator